MSSAVRTESTVYIIVATLIADRYAPPSTFVGRTDSPCPHHGKEAAAAAKARKLVELINISLFRGRKEMNPNVAVIPGIRDQNSPRVT
jgi:hypothetical protein